MGTEGSLQCIECGLSGKKRDVRRHIEAKHMANTHVSCSLCGKVVKTRDSLRKHMEKEHREWKTWLLLWCGWKHLAEINQSFRVLSKVMLPQCIWIRSTWVEGNWKPTFQVCWNQWLQRWTMELDLFVWFVKKWFFTRETWRNTLSACTSVKAPKSALFVENLSKILIPCKTTPVSTTED